MSNSDCASNERQEPRRARGEEFWEAKMHVNASLHHGRLDVRVTLALAMLRKFTQFGFAESLCLSEGSVVAFYMNSVILGLMIGKLGTVEKRAFHVSTSVICL
jgi:hypothetical protein